MGCCPDPNPAAIMGGADVPSDPVGDRFIGGAAEEVRALLIPLLDTPASVLLRHQFMAQRPGGRVTGGGIPAWTDPDVNASDLVAMRGQWIVLTAHGYVALSPAVFTAWFTKVE